MTRSAPSQASPALEGKLASLTDSELLSSCADRVELALEELYTRHGGRCLVHARSVLIDHHHAQEAVQDAFLDAWRGAAGYDPNRASVISWLLMLTHRRSVDTVRREQRRPRWVPLAGEPGLLGGLMDGADPAEETVTRILGSRAAALLQHVPLQQRRCLVLAYWGGYTMNEIAVLVDAPVGTVKTRCRAALKNLRLLVIQHGLDSLELGPAASSRPETSPPTAGDR